MTREALKGHLDMLVLATLATRPLHGYAVIEALRTKSRGAFDLPEGTVYPVLHRLEHAGLLKSRWNRETGRKRRVYRLTARGKRQFKSEQVKWVGFASAVSTVLENTA